MLEERDEVGRDGEQLAGRDVHVVDGLDRNLGGGAEGPVVVTRARDDGVGIVDAAVGVDSHEPARLGIDGDVRGGDDVVLLLVCRHPVDVAGDDAVHDATIRRLDEAVLVDVRVEGERADQADVGPLGGLDRAHATVVRVVDVAHRGRDVGATAGAALVTRKATRAEGREAALVREARQRVGLVHELRQLGGAVELLDGGHDRSDVDQGLRRDVVHVLGGHALADDALHAAHADAELVLHQLADRAHATVAKVVDVIELLGLVAAMQGEEVAQGGDDVLVGQDLLRRLELKAELLVDLVAADTRKVVALAVEVEAVEQRARGVHGGGLAGALATVDLDEGVLAGGGDVALERGADDVGVAEETHDLVVALGDAQGAQQQGRALTTLAVDGDDQVTVLVDLELEPGAARGDELRVVGLDAVVHLLGEVDARGADELRDDDALGAVDDEGAALGHEREVAHEDELLLDLARLLVDEAHVDEEGRLIGDVLGAALGNGAGGIAKLMLAERDLHGPRGVLDGRELGEGLGKSVGHESLERLLLNGDEIGQLHGSRNLAEAHARAQLPLCGLGRLCGRHQALPPSTRQKSGSCRNLIK